MAPGLAEPALWSQYPEAGCTREASRPCLEEPNLWGAAQSRAHHHPQLLSVGDAHPALPKLLPKPPRLTSSRACCRLDRKFRDKHKGACSRARLLGSFLLPQPSQICRLRWGRGSGLTGDAGTCLGFASWKSPVQVNY